MEEQREGGEIERHHMKEHFAATSVMFDRTLPSQIKSGGIQIHHDTRVYTRY